MRWTSTSVEQTEALGRRLGQAAFAGTVVALDGDLGAGKTAFARGVGAGLAVTSRVASPTYIIVQTHEGGRLPLRHADLYRVGDVSDLEQLGLDELLDDGVLLLEWASRFPEWLPADHLQIVLQGEDDVRQLDLIATGPRHQALLERITRA